MRCIHMLIFMESLKSIEMFVRFDRFCKTTTAFCSSLRKRHMTNSKRMNNPKWKSIPNAWGVRTYIQQ